MYAKITAPIKNRTVAKTINVIYLIPTSTFVPPSLIITKMYVGTETRTNATRIIARSCVVKMYMVASIISPTKP